MKRIFIISAAIILSGTFAFGQGTNTRANKLTTTTRHTPVQTNTLMFAPATAEAPLPATVKRPPVTFQNGAGFLFANEINIQTDTTRRRIAPAAAHQTQKCIFNIEK